MILYLKTASFLVDLPTAKTIYNLENINQKFTTLSNIKIRTLALNLHIALLYLLKKCDSLGVGIITTMPTTITPIFL